MATVDLTKSRDLTGPGAAVLRVKLQDRGRGLELSVLPPTVALQRELEAEQSDLDEALGSGVEEAGWRSMIWQHGCYPIIGRAYTSARPSCPPDTRWPMTS